MQQTALFVWRRGWFECSRPACTCMTHPGCPSSYGQDKPGASCCCQISSCTNWAKETFCIEKQSEGSPDTIIAIIKIIAIILHTVTSSTIRTAQQFYLIVFGHRRINVYNSAQFLW